MFAFLYTCTPKVAFSFLNDKGPNKTSSMMYRFIPIWIDGKTGIDLTLDHFDSLHRHNYGYIIQNGSQAAYQLIEDRGQLKNLMTLLCHKESNILKNSLGKKLPAGFRLRNDQIRTKSSTKQNYDDKEIYVKERILGRSFFENSPADDWYEPEPPEYRIINDSKIFIRKYFRSRTSTLKIFDYNKAKASWHNFTNVVFCPLGHVTQWFVSCDPKVQCYVKDYVDVDSCVREIPFFTCTDDYYSVPFSLVCDHKHDCPGGGDEDFCVFEHCQGFTCLSGQCIHNDKVKVYYSK